MRNYKIQNNAITTMLVVAENHKVSLQIKTTKGGKLICKDDEGNRWVGLEEILDFFSEMIVDTTLCTKEQIIQIRGLWDDTSKAPFPLAWLIMAFEREELQAKGEN